jgi:hypothetical protein
MRGDRPQGTKLLIATIGLATVSYVGCGGPDHPPGNLMATPEPTETVSPDASATALPSGETPESKPTDMPHGNLMPPPPPPPKQ